MNTICPFFEVQRGLFFVGILSLILLPARQVEGIDEGQGIDREKILEVWQKRAVGSSTLEIVAEGKQYEAKREYDSNMLTKAGAENLQPFTLPAKTFAVTFRYSLAPGKARNESRGLTFSVKKMDYVEDHAIDVFDGTIRKAYIGKGQMEYPGAHFYKGETRETVAQNMWVLPILLVYRAVGDDLPQFKAERLVVDGGTVLHDGRKCVLIRYNESVILADVSRDFLPLRYQRIREGKLLQSIDISYRNDEKLGWVPASWTNAQYRGSDQLIRSVTLTVTKVSINDQLPSDQFELPPLPDGTWVRNYMTGEDYILQKGGNRRDVAPFEFDGTNYEQLLHSDPSGSSRLWILSAILLLILIFAIFIYRNVRMRRVALSK